MNREAQIKLQSFLDGELSEAENREVSAWLARDQEAATLLVELRNTRGALAGVESEVRLPETQEFYWSKIKREIEHLGSASTPAPTDSPFHRLRRFLIPAGAVAVLLIAGFLTFTELNTGHGTRAPQLVAKLADTSAITYRDQTTGTTLVWFSYPAEKQFAADNAADVGSNGK